MTTAYYSHPDCHRHDMGRGHPECPARLDAINDHLLATGLDVALARRDAPQVDQAAVERAHAGSYVTALRDALQPLRPGAPLLQIDPDTAAGAGTWAAVQRAAGAAVAATDEVIGGQVSNAFCAVRPPGHHAMHAQAMGFCFFNNVAIAARHALEVHGLQRVAVVDFDVHHGNGTEDILAGDERVLMVGIFQDQLYPNSGNHPRGANMLNLPMPAYSRGPAVRAAIEAHWLPRLEAFRPEMIFISAGFDAHRDDELAQLGLVEADYEWITRRLKDVAERHAGGRIVSCLEGGYNLGALARSVAAHLRVLAEV